MSREGRAVLWLGALRVVPRRLFAQWRWLATIAGITIGCVAGWWAGSYTACQEEGCVVSLEAIGVVGTWVGGVGTIAALVFAVIALRADIAARDRDERRGEQERHVRLNREQREAEAMVIRATWTHTRAGVIYEAAIAVRNETAKTTAFKVDGKCALWGVRLHGAAKIAGSAQVITPIHLDGLKGGLNHPIPVPKDAAAWEAEVVATCEITFEMHDRKWRRAGGATTEIP